MRRPTRFSRPPCSAVRAAHYLVWTDAVAWISISVLVIALTETLIVHYMIRTEYRRLGLAVDKAMRVVLPMSHLLLLAILLLVTVAGAEPTTPYYPPLLYLHDGAVIPRRPSLTCYGAARPPQSPATSRNLPSRGGQAGKDQTEACIVVGVFGFGGVVVYSAYYIRGEVRKSNLAKLKVIQRLNELTKRSDEIRDSQRDEIERKAAQVQINKVRRRRTLHAALRHMHVAHVAHVTHVTGLARHV